MEMKDVLKTNIYDVADKGELVQISPNTIKMSKNLIELKNNLEEINV